MPPQIPLPLTPKRDAVLAGLADPAAPTTPGALTHFDPKTGQWSSGMADQGIGGQNAAAAQTKVTTPRNPDLGNRDYLNDLGGGSAWYGLQGPPPAGYDWNANGGVKQQSLLEKFDNAVMTPEGFALGITGMAAAPAMGAGGSLGKFATQVAAGSAGTLAKNTLAPGQQADQGPLGPNEGGPGGAAIPQGSTAGAGGTSGTTPATTSAADTATTPASTVPAGDTNGFAAPQYTAANSSKQALPGWDQTKWG